MRERQQESICVSLCGEVEGGGAGSSAALCSAVVQAFCACCHLPFFSLFFLGKPCPAAKAKQTAALATTEQRQAEAAERFKLRVSEGTKS